VFTARYALSPYIKQIRVKTERDHRNTFRLSSVSGNLETMPRKMYQKCVNQAARGRGRWGEGRNVPQYHLKFRALLRVLEKTLDSHAQFNHVCIRRTNQATCQHRRSDRGERSENEILEVKSNPETE